MGKTDTNTWFQAASNFAEEAVLILDVHAHVQCVSLRVPHKRHDLQNFLPALLAKGFKSIEGLENF